MPGVCTSCRLLSWRRLVVRQPTSSNLWLAGLGAVVGFAGPRVIKQTIGQDLPEGFQTAEFLLEHGMVDAVVPRSELRDTTGQLLRHMAGRQPAEAAD